MFDVAVDPAVEEHQVELGLAGRKPKRRRNLTRQGKRPVAPDRVGRKFGAPVPDVLWCGDVTEIATDQGKLYLATVIDLFFLASWSPPPMEVIVWVRFTVARQDAVRTLLVQTQGVCEQRGLVSERSGPGCQVHRRAGDSIPSIMGRDDPSTGRQRQTVCHANR